jgi:hypothetical protein
LVKIDFYNSSFKKSPLERGFRGVYWVKKALNPNLQHLKTYYTLLNSPSRENFSKNTTLFDTEPAK